MEIKYKRTYTPGVGKLYTAGEINAMLGYALEVADPRARLKEGKLAPGEVCMIIFGITPEEYALRESNSKQLDKLAENLRKHCPADRLIGWRIVDLKGAPVQKAVQLEGGESIDGGAFIEAMKERRSKVQAGPLDGELIACARLQQACKVKDAPEEKKAEWLAARRALGAKLAQLEQIWAMDDACTNGRFPGIGFDGRIELFTLESRANAAKARVEESANKAELWQIRALSGGEIAAYLRRCAGDGLNGLRIDNGFAAAELQIADVLDVPEAENAPLRSMMLRDIEYGLRWRRLKDANAAEPAQRGALESMLTLRNFAWRQIGNVSLYVLCAGEGTANCLAVSEQQGGPRMLAVFTEPLRAAAFAERMPGSARATKLPYDEIVKRAASCAGMVIDVGAINYRVPKEAFEKIVELRSKPPQIVRVQPPKPAETLAPAPAQPAATLGDLPDPDKIMPKAKVEEPASVEEIPEETKPENEKKGFFKRFFGK